MSTRSRIRIASVVVTYAAIAGIWGCGDEGTEPEGLEPTFRATWAEEPWEGEARASYGLTEDTLYISGISPVGAGAWDVESIVRIRVLYEGTGTYDLGPGDATFARLLGGDVLVGQYATTTEEAGTLVITEGTGYQVDGVIVFEAEDVFGPSPTTSRARFEGVFKATISE